MTHPTYPLQSEQTDHTRRIIQAGASMGQIQALNEMYDRYRDQEFPNWRSTYDAQMKLWFAANGQKIPPCGE